MSTNSIKAILYDLIASQSDTGTELERNMAEKLAGYIERDPYFQAHPHQWGCETEGDILNRPVVWALKKGRTSKTIILSGHYDTVEIDCYGELRSLALNPDGLKEKIKTLALTNEKLKADLLDDNWLFGRGSADMKAGLAINLHLLLTEENPPATILFTAVCDEENISAGARQSLPLYLRLRERFGLDYRLTLITEPQYKAGDSFAIFNGGPGKLLPIIVAKGRLSHCAEPLKGLNAAHIIAEITRSIDLNTSLCTEDLGVSTQPPVILSMTDMKTTHGVSLPMFSAACVNLLFLNSRNTAAIMEKIKRICRASMRVVIDKYEESFAYARFHDLISDSDYQTYAPVVLDLSELEEIVKANKEDSDFCLAALKREITEKIKGRELTLRKASLYYVKTMIEMSGLDYPLVVVGIAPPYYPAVCNEYLGKELSVFLSSIKSVVEGDYKMKVQLCPYIASMGDISYMSCVNPREERALMSNLALPPSLYDIPFEDAAALNTPCFCLGPRCGDIHQWSERVYLPDVEHVVPDAIRNIINHL